ncbi:MAG: sterol desaturase family protein, partial [Gammaproteobacteria bacterium]|nr:sterol desaturase family protein [Gammaproteobacteria bacterium]
ALAEKASLILFVVLFAIWEARRPARPRRGTLQALDLIAVVNVGLFSVACKWLLTPSVGFESAPLGELPLAAKIVAALITIDFTLYWLHRGMHNPLLWNTHRFHHSVKQMDWLKGIYTSGTHIAMYLAPQVLIGYYVFGFSRVEMALAVIIGYFVQFWQHANVTIEIGVLKYLFVTPQSHRLHHALGEDVRDRNFGAVFSVWDVLFGTYVAPSHEDYELGIEGDVPVVRGLIGV